jgi:hypothetical protein
MNTYSQIVYNQAMMNNNVLTAIALSRCNNNQHRTSSMGDGIVMLILLVTTIIAIYITVRKSW